MFGHVAGFELKYQLKSPVFWGTIVIFGLLAYVSVASDTMRFGWGGQVYRNAPYAIAMQGMIWTIFAMFIVVAFVAGGVLRDDETGFGPIIQATRLSKINYLFGRFTGGFLAASLAFLSVPLGALLAVVIPGPDPETVGPIRIADYLYVYLAFCVPTLFVLCAGFFALATASRSLIATYIGMLVVLAIYLLTRSYLNRPEFGPLAMLTDPFGLAAFNHATKAWTAFDRNNLLPPMSGLILHSRLVWIAVALGFLAIAWRSFIRKGFVARADRRPARESKLAAEATIWSGAAPLPPSDRTLGWGPLVALTRFELLGVLRSPIFIVLLGYTFINQFFTLWLAGDTDVALVYPVTRVMIQTLIQFTAIPLFIAAFYAGELVWRDRERRIHEIVDSTPSPDWAFLLPKIFAISALMFAIGLISIVGAISVQLLKGFTDIDYGRYLTWFLAPWFLTMVMYAALAVFVQTLVPHKFVGLLVILLYYIAVTALPTMGYESHLYIYASTSPTPFSDMNGLGYYAGYAAWYRLYWAAGAVILTVLAWGLWRRGASAPLLMRVKRLPWRLAGIPGGILAAAALVMAGVGGWIYYNNYVLNAFPTFNESQRWAAEYEKTLLPYEAHPQPHITDVKLNVDLDPDRIRAVTRGSYVIENKTGAPISNVYVAWAHPQVSKNFLGTAIEPGVTMRALDVPGARVTREFRDFNFRIYTYDTPMAPGERREIRFETVREQRGFRNSGNDDRIVQNGTFLSNFSITPNLGVSRRILLQDRATRRKYGLDPDLKIARLEDGKGRAHSYVRHDSDYVNADITVTGPTDQVLLAAGRQVSKEVVGNRQIVRFLSEAPMAHMFSIQAARYTVRKDQWKDVDLEIYYHPTHRYNIDRFVALAKESLAYYSANFSPYQFKQLRIVEFPAYSSFAQAFPGTVPYSESSGFIARIDDTTGIDLIAYVTAHEIGHQWWGHQVVGGDQQGSTTLTETLAQYAATMVMEKRYGKAMIRRFLQASLGGYLSARGQENVAEPPLERVEMQAHVRYQKGGLVMYLLRDRMGEEAVNRALRTLIRRYALKGAPYPTSRDLIAALRAEAKPEHQQLITDLFQHITLYDLKVDDARAKRRPDGRWDVNFTVEARKRYADGVGAETEAALNEVFDIGVFTAQPADRKFTQDDVLSMQSVRLKSGRRKISIVVDRKPSFVGLDPYIKYIDRNIDDNVISISQH